MDRETSASEKCLELLDEIIIGNIVPYQRYVSKSPVSEKIFDTRFQRKMNLMLNIYSWVYLQRTAMKY